MVATQPRAGFQSQRFRWAACHGTMTMWAFPCFPRIDDGRDSGQGACCHHKAGSGKAGSNRDSTALTVKGNRRRGGWIIWKGPESQYRPVNEKRFYGKFRRNTGSGSSQNCKISVCKPRNRSLYVPRAHGDHATPCAKGARAGRRRVARSLVASCLINPHAPGPASDAACTTKHSN